MKKLMLVVFAVIQIVILSACRFQDGPHDIYTTVYPLQFVAEEILKETDLTVGIVPGVTSHESSVDWSPKEIIAMTEAKYLFYVGANYDYYIDYQIDSIFANKDVELVKVELETDYIEFIPGILHEHDHEEEHVTLNESALGTDPHFWISPLKVLAVSYLIYDKLVEAYPENEELMETNFTNLQNKLQTLHEDFEEGIGGLTKPVMTSTNLYGYLHHDYDLEFLPISPGYHEETDQFTTSQKEEIVNEALYHDIRYLIYEKYTTSPFSNAVFSELELLGKDPVKVEFHILQSIKDEDVDAGKNYITVMYENLELLKAAGEYTEVEE
jgi:zinc transport system substrate-binding protein